MSTLMDDEPAYELFAIYDFDTGEYRKPDEDEEAMSAVVVALRSGMDELRDDIKAAIAAAAAQRSTPSTERRVVERDRDGLISAVTIERQD